MKLSRTQYVLLIDMVNASIKMAGNSGIPISDMVWKEVETIKEVLYEEMRRATQDDINQQTATRT